MVQIFVAFSEYLKFILVQLCFYYRFPQFLFQGTFTQDVRFLGRQVDRAPSDFTKQACVVNYLIRVGRQIKNTQKTSDVIYDCSPKYSIKKKSSITRKNTINVQIRINLQKGFEPIVTFMLSSNETWLQGKIYVIQTSWSALTASKINVFSVFNALSLFHAALELVPVTSLIFIRYFSILELRKQVIGSYKYL